MRHRQAESRQAARADSRIARRRPESDIFGPVPRALCIDCPLPKALSGPTSEDRSSTAPIVGQVAVVTATLDPQGSVHAGGEEWTAVSDSGEPIDEGEQVIVSEADGLTLKVFRSSEAFRDSDL